MRSCLIQVEYFHLNMKGSLGDLWREALDRTIETLPDATHGLNDMGAGIKTCLRFHDTESGAITRLALDIESLVKQIEDAVSITVATDSSWVRRKLYRWKWGRLCLALEAHRKMLTMVIARQISQSVLAIEKVNRHYRLLRDDERHEVLAKIKTTSNFWLFVFTPNNLLSDRNELVTAVM